MADKTKNATAPAAFAADNTVADRDAAGQDWWWLVVRNPAREIHLYEIGPAVDVDQHDNPDDPAEVTGTSQQALTDERLDVILAELGGPPRTELTAGGDWSLEMSPGRPDGYLEPVAYATDGTELPLRAKAGVTLHLLPETEPGTPTEEE
jgi:hypothetical protein